MSTGTTRSRDRTAIQIEALNGEDVEKLRDMLIEKRAVLIGQIISLKQDAVDGSDSGNWEEDGTDAFDREFAFKMAGSSNELLNQIDESLRRIDENTYGSCDLCGEKIGKARMQALPFCQMCISCKSEAESGGPRRVRVPA